jgi:hypothetical protein
MAGKQVRAIASFATEIDGSERLIHVGEVFPANHPVVKACRELFVPEVPEPAKAGEVR